MKICMLVRAMTTHSRGGLEHHTMVLAEGLVEKGHQVVLITTRHPQGIETEELNGVKVHYLNSVRTRTKYFFRDWKPEGIRRFIWLHNEYKFDLIHSQATGGMPLLLTDLPERFNLPTVMTLHGTMYDEIKTAIIALKGIKNPWLAKRYLPLIPWQIYQHFRYYAPAAKRAKILIATSIQQKEIMKRAYSLGEERLRLIYNGIDINLFKPTPPDEELRAKLELKPENRVLFWVGRMTPEKGVQLAIKAMVEILKQIQEARLIIMGEGQYQGYLKRLALRLGIKKEVLFLNSVPYERLPDYLNLSEAYLHPTFRVEAAPLVVPQTMGCGKVVIAPGFGGITTPIKDGQTGILIPIGNYKALAQAAIRVLKDSELRQSIEKAAREMVVREFSQEKMVNQTIKVYEEVLKPAIGK